MNKHPFKNTSVTEKRAYFSDRFTDVSAHKEQSYQDIFNGVQDAIFVESFEGKILDANRAACEMFGYSRDELLSKSVVDLVPTGYPILMPEHDAQQESAAPPIESVNMRANGEVFPIEISSRLHFLNGEPIAFVVVRDISERKRAEKALLTQTTALQAVANGVVITDRNGIIQWVNPALTRLTGYSAEEVIGKNPRLFKSGLQDDAFYKALWETISAGQVWRGEVTNCRKDGSLYAEEMTITPVCAANGEIEEFIAIKQDVSERKRADEVIQMRLHLTEFAATHSLEELLQKTLDEVSLITASAVGFYHFVAPDQKTLSLQAWSTRTLQEFCTIADKELHYPVEKAGVWVECIHARKPVIHNDYAALPNRKGLPEGHAPVIRELVVPIFRDDKIVAVLGVGNKPTEYTQRDVELVTYLADIAWELAEQKRAEKALLTSQQRYKTLSEISPVGIFHTNAQGKTIYVNPHWCKISGVSEKDALNDAWLNAVHPDDREVIASGWTEAVQLEKKSKTEYRFLRPDGTIRWVLGQAVPEKNAAGETIGYVGTITDITSRKQAEKILLRQVQELMVLQEISTICAQVESEDDLISRITPVIGDTFYPDHFGVFTVDEATKKLVPHPSLQAGKHSGQLPLLPLDDAGINGEVLASGKTANYGDVRQLTQYIPLVADMRSYLCAPLKSGERSLGVVHAESRHLDFFKREDERLMTIIGEQIGIAIDRLRLLDAEHTRRKEAESLRHAAATLTFSLDINEVLDSLLTELADVIPYYSSAVFLEENGYLCLLAGRGFSVSQEVIGKRYPATDQLFSLCQQTREPILIEDAQVDSRFQGWGDGGKIRGWMGIPLLMKEKVIGFLTVDSIVPGAYTSAHTSVALIFAHQASVAIENARLFGETKKQLEQLKALREIDMTISSTTELQLSLDVLLKLVMDLQGVDAADILLVNKNTNLLEYARGEGFHSRAIEKKSLGLDEGLAGEAIQAGSSLLIPDLSKTASSFVRQELLEGEKFQAYAAVPLVTRGQVLGVLEVFHRQNLELDSAWLRFLETLAGQASIAIDNARSFKQLTKANQDLFESYQATIEGWASALEYRDGETEGHSQRVTQLSVRLAEKMGLHGEALVNFRWGALLHDIGKIGVPDAILRKPGPLTDDEWDVMRQHPLFSREMLVNIPFLKFALDIPLYHHEKWDGSGYPEGLQEENIPLSARIFAFADVFDALTSDRPYRKAWSQPKALDYIKEQSGIHFDPSIVPIFLEMSGEEMVE